MSWACASCGFELYLPIEPAGLRTTQVGLYDDGRFPGRCIVALRHHAEHLELLDTATLTSLWTDAAAVGSAVLAATGAARINYAVLGNAQPHLHVHVIPRDPVREPLPTRPPWNDPRDTAPMDPATLRRLRAGIESALARQTRP